MTITRDENRSRPIGANRSTSARAEAQHFHERTIPALTLAVAMACLGVGCLSLSTNSLESYPVPMLGLLALSLALLEIEIYHRANRLDRSTLVQSFLALAAAVVLCLLPEYIYGLNVNGIIHRSFFSAILLLFVGLPAACSALCHLLENDARATSISRWPLIALPIVLALGAYALLIGRLLAEGAPHLDWTIISQPYLNQITEVPGGGNEATITQIGGIHQAGLSNHILGTLLLMLLTSLISLPIGVGTGLYLSEWAGGWLAQTIRFSTMALRSISVFILGLTAYSLIGLARGNWLSDILLGYYYDVNGAKHVADGSFITAAIVLSLLVIPIIARATEEGCRSVPPRLREGSAALGASEAFTLGRIVLPWSLPNIVTSLLLGCAEVAGSVAVIMFIAGSGENGIGPFNQVTSLAYLVFDAKYGLPQLTDLMQPYQFSAVIILLLIIAGLTVPALILKNRFAARYRQRAS